MPSLESFWCEPKKKNPTQQFVTQQTINVRHPCREGGLQRGPPAHKARARREGPPAHQGPPSAHPGAHRDRAPAQPQQRGGTEGGLGCTHRGPPCNRGGPSCTQRGPTGCPCTQTEGGACAPHLHIEPPPAHTEPCCSTGTYLQHHQSARRDPGEIFRSCFCFLFRGPGPLRRAGRGALSERSKTHRPGMCCPVRGAHQGLDS